MKTGRTWWLVLVVVFNHIMAYSIGGVEQRTFLQPLSFSKMLTLRTIGIWTCSTFSYEWWKSLWACEEGKERGKQWWIRKLSGWTCESAGTYVWSYFGLTVSFKSAAWMFLSNFHILPSPTFLRMELHNRESFSIQNWGSGSFSLLRDFGSLEWHALYITM